MDTPEVETAVPSCEPMTKEQEAHLARVIAVFAAACDIKYRRGQREHGGNLFDCSALELAEEAIREAVDQIVYLVTLRDKLAHGAVHRAPVLPMPTSIP